VSFDEQLVLGVDLDAVCGDYEDALRASVARRTGRDPAELSPQTTWDAYSEWGMSFAEFEEAHRTAVVEDRIFREMQPLPGVSEALWQLSDEGVWIRIITHRLIFNGAHEVSAADTAWWLDHHRIPYRDLCFIGDKPDVGADVYIDDSPRNIIGLAGRRPHRHRVRPALQPRPRRPAGQLLGRGHRLRPGSARGTPRPAAAPPGGPPVTDALPTPPSWTCSSGPTS
jgi:5'-nucleotidase